MARLLGILLLSAAACATAPHETPKQQTTSAPEDRFAAISAWATEVHSPAGMIVVDDTTVFSWGDLAKKMHIHSCRKSFLSALIGIAVARGEMDLSATLASLDIDDEPEPLTAEEKRASLRDLLEARSGVYHEASNETDAMKKERPPRGSHPHGTHWYYNNWDFNTLGGIYESLTKRSIFEAFETEIARPIGMEDYVAADGTYSRSRVSRYPGYLFSMSTRDLARFGRLYLRNGEWNGRQIVPREWIAESTTSHSETRTLPGGGYGYLWWTGGDGKGLFRDVDLGPGAFAAEGFAGHYIVVIPRWRAVVVTRADDAWYLEDPTHRNIGSQREGKLLGYVVAALRHL